MHAAQEGAALRMHRILGTGPLRQIRCKPAVEAVSSAAKTGHINVHQGGGEAPLAQGVAIAVALCCVLQLRV